MSETEPFGPTPQHVAIIMDGNGRWAASRVRPSPPSPVAPSAAL